LKADQLQVHVGLLRLSEQAPGAVFLIGKLRDDVAQEPHLGIELFVYGLDSKICSINRCVAA
jgi:hypothetical protein